MQHNSSAVISAILIKILKDTHFSDVIYLISDQDWGEIWAHVGMGGGAGLKHRNRKASTLYLLPSLWRFQPLMCTRFAEVLLAKKRENITAWLSSKADEVPLFAEREVFVVRCLEIANTVIYCEPRLHCSSDSSVYPTHQFLHFLPHTIAFSDNRALSQSRPGGGGGGEQNDHLS